MEESLGQWSNNIKTIQILDCFYKWESKDTPNYYAPKYVTARCTVGIEINKFYVLIPTNVFFFLWTGTFRSFFYIWSPYVRRPALGSGELKSTQLLQWRMLKSTRGYSCLVLSNKSVHEKLWQPYIVSYCRSNPAPISLPFISTVICRPALTIKQNV